MTIYGHFGQIEITEVAEFNGDDCLNDVFADQQTVTVPAHFRAEVVSTGYWTGNTDCITAQDALIDLYERLARNAACLDILNCPAFGY
jgi:hypothetical protein